MLGLAILASQLVSVTGPATETDVELAVKLDLFFGQDVAAYGDWDGDGRDDYLVTAPRMWDDARTGPICSRVYLVSGRDASALLVVRVPGRWTASRVQSIADLDGDGARDLLIAGDYAPVYVVSGKTGAFVRTIGETDASKRAWIRTAPIDDLDADGVADIVWQTPGELHFQSGRSGSELREPLQVNAHAFAGAPDLDADGVADLVYATPSVVDEAGWAQASLRVVSLREGKQLSETLVRHDRRARCVPLAVDPGGKQLVLGVAHSINDDCDGEAWLWSLPKLDRQRPLVPAKPSRTFGYDVALGGDVNKDGVGDVLVAAVTTCFDARDWGSVSVFSGADGALLRSQAGDGVYGDCFSAVAWIGDVDGDGATDYACSAVPHLDRTACIGSYVEVRSGATGELLVELPKAWGKR